MHDNDTVAAISTPPGNGGIGIIRISGAEAEQVLERVFRPAGHQTFPLENRRMVFGRVMSDGATVDECLAVVMRAPHSYTGETVAELQTHAGYYHLQKILDLCFQAGARPAEPGEFTRRAFLNGRMDLSRAEAVMSIIMAESEQAHQAAIRQLEGGTASFIRGAAEELYRIQAGIAACVDYPEEVSDEEALAGVLPSAVELADRLEAACDERGARLTEQGLHVALYGRPNVGKSSLLNALLGEEKAIVTEIPGTTRDLVTGSFTLGGSLIHLVDTAGIRETEDPVEQIGVRRSEKALRHADVAVLVLDASVPVTDEDRQLLSQMPDRAVILWNKEDLLSDGPSEQPQLPDMPAGRQVPCFTVSALQPDTLLPFKNWLREQATVTDQLVLTQPRHLDAVKRAVSHLRDAVNTMQTFGADLAATDLQAAQLALAEVTGDRTDEKLLDEVFSRFCVGK